MSTIAGLPMVTWAELEQTLKLNPSCPATAPIVVTVPTVGVTHARSTRAIADLKAYRCKDGERTSHLLALAGALIAAGDGVNDCIAQCQIWNLANHDVLPDEKVVLTCQSVWDADVRNHPERHPGLKPVEPLFRLADGRVDRFLGSPPTPRRWLLKDNIVLGKVGAIVSPGGKGKSQWLLQLAVSVATGTRMADHWEVGEVGGVLMFLAEDDYDEIHRRIYSLKQHLALTGRTKELLHLVDRLHVFSTVGVNTLLTRASTSGEVLQTDLVARMTALAKQVENLKLIVIDPVSRFRGGEENSNEDATRFAEALESIAQRTGASVIAAHHASKASYSTDIGQGAARGASAFTDAMRFQLNLGTPTPDQAKQLGLPTGTLSKFLLCSVVKTNYAAPADPVLLERLNGGYLRAVNAAQATTNATNDMSIRVVQAINSEGRPISLRALEDAYGGVRGPLKISKHLLRKIVDQAIKGGLLVGGNRVPLKVTAHGADLARCVSVPTEIATAAEKRRPRTKDE